jgi:hypothetical protein
MDNVPAIVARCPNPAAVDAILFDPHLHRADEETLK